MKLPKRQKETRLYRDKDKVVAGRQRKEQFTLRSDYLRKPLKIAPRRKAPRLRKERCLCKGRESRCMGLQHSRSAR